LPSLLSSEMPSSQSKVARSNE